MDRPYLSRRLDRLGNTRWRILHNGRSISLPGQPGEARFEAAYKDAVEARARAGDDVGPPLPAAPRTLRAAWHLATSETNPDWKRLRKSSRRHYLERAEKMLAAPVGDGKRKWESVEVGELRRRHIEALIDEASVTPYATQTMLVVLNKLIAVAVDQKWIDADPMEGVRFRPRTIGWRAWTDDERAKFEERWPLGSTPRTVYALALYGRLSKAEIVRCKWTDVETVAPGIVRSPLRKALEAAPRQHRYVLTNRYGKPYSFASLRAMMRYWTERAGISGGATIVGLHKTGRQRIR